MTTIRYSYNLEKNKLNIHKNDESIILPEEVEVTQDEFLEIQSNLVYGKKYKLYRKKLIVDSSYELEVKKQHTLAERNRLLSECDWVMLPDVYLKLEEVVRDEWVKYRQELRDLTSLPNFPDVDFPRKPEKCL